jgi:ankyrin repeat protein
MTDKISEEVRAIAPIVNLTGKLNEAVRTGSFDTVRDILSDIDKENQKVAELLFIRSCRENSINAVKILLDTGYKLKLNEGLFVATDHGHVELSKLLLDAGAGDNGYFDHCLTNCCLAGLPEIVQLILDKIKMLVLFDDSSVDFDHAFRMACLGNHPDIVRLVDPYVRNDNPCYNPDIWTNLFVECCGWGHYEIVKYLLEKHDLQNSYREALVMAFKSRNYRIAMYLAKKLFKEKLIKPKQSK